jgi:hypothetical protein
VLDRTAPIEAGRTGDGTAHDGAGTARRGEFGIGRTEERHDRSADGRRQVAHARVATHQDVHLCQEGGQQSGAIAAHEVRDRCGAGNRFGHRAVARRPQQYRGKVPTAERLAQVHDALARPHLGRAVRRAEVDADPRPGNSPEDALQERADLAALLPVGVGPGQAGLALGRGRSQVLDEEPVLVDLMPSRLGQRHGVGQEP